MGVRLPWGLRSWGLGVSRIAGASSGPGLRTSSMEYSRTSKLSSSPTRMRTFTRSRMALISVITPTPSGVTMSLPTRGTRLRVCS